MSISSLGIGSSGMQAYQNALTISANNVANTLTNGFQPSSANFQEASPAGTGVQVSATSATGQSASSNSSAPSGTNVTDEMVNQVIYKAGFNASATLVKTSDQMIGSLLDTKA